MRFNPPPNWPQPPKDWVPPPGWAPDPSWPPPPADWDLWIDDDAEDGQPEILTEQPRHALALSRAEDDGGEYFGDQQAWADAPPERADVRRIEPREPEADTPTQRVEVLPGDLSVRHVGLRAEVRWDDVRRYEIGTIASISSNASAVNVLFVGSDQPAATFLRESPHPGARDPKLYVWLES